MSGGPIFHDLYVTHCLLELGKITKNDVVINGNSGDFITGNHIPIQLSPTMLDSCPEDQIEDVVIKCFLINIVDCGQTCRPMTICREFQLIFKIFYARRVSKLKKKMPTFVMNFWNFITVKLRM